MTSQEILKVRAELLTRGTSLAAIARELRVSRQHVYDVVRGRTVSARVRAAISRRLGRDPWSGAAPSGS